MAPTSRSSTSLARSWAPNRRFYFFIAVTALLVILNAMMLYRVVWDHSASTTDAAGVVKVRARPGSLWRLLGRCTHVQVAFRAALALAEAIAHAAQPDGPQPHRSVHRRGPDYLDHSARTERDAGAAPATSVVRVQRGRRINPRRAVHPVAPPYGR